MSTPSLCNAEGLPYGYEGRARWPRCILSPGHQGTHMDSRQYRWSVNDVYPLTMPISHNYHSRKLGGK